MLLSGCREVAIASPAPAPSMPPVNTDDSTASREPIPILCISNAKNMEPRFKRTINIYINQIFKLHQHNEELVNIVNKDYSILLYAYCILYLLYILKRS